MLAVQIRMARAALGCSIVEFAERAEVSTNTLVRLERGEELKQSTLDHLCRVLERSGIEFLVDNDGSFGVKFREPRDFEQSSFWLFINSCGATLSYVEFTDRLEESRYSG